MTVEAEVQTDDVVFADQIEKDRKSSRQSHMSGSQMSRSKSGQVPSALNKSPNRIGREDSSNQDHLLHDSSTAVGTL